MTNTKTLLQRNRESIKKGFTLAELLIVVAIIAVLVAVAIPVFTAQLEKARRATDVANLRSLYAEASAARLTEEVSDNFSPYGLDDSGDVEFQWAKRITFNSNGLTDEDWASLPFEDVDGVGVAIHPGQEYTVGFAFFKNGKCGIFDAN